MEVSAHLPFFHSTIKLIVVMEPLQSRKLTDGENPVLLGMKNSLDKKTFH